MVLNETQGEADNLPQLINCDWLQFWCHYTTFDPERWSRETNYKCKNTHRGTRVFAEVWNVTEKAAYTSSRRDEPFAVMACRPYSPLIDAKMVLVKIENRPLYHSNLYRRIVLMLHGFGLQYKAITRLDLCCDLVRFSNGMHPLELLERYRQNELLKNGSRSYCQWLTAPYTLTTAPFKLGEKVANAIHVTHSVSWGGAKADAHVKMYNKSREIKVESGKRYIQRWWRLNGLDTTEDVWRVEISVGGRSRALIDDQSGELVQISLLEACSIKYQRAAFLALAERHFHFADISNAKNRRKAQPLQLFDIATAAKFSTITMPSKPNPTRTTRVCMNYLAELPNQVQLSAFCRSDRDAAAAIYRCMVVLAEIYDELSIVNKGYKWKAENYARQMLSDLQLLQSFGVVRYKDSAERLEDIAAILESNDKRRELESSLYTAYLLQREGCSLEPFHSKEEQEKVASEGARSGSQEGAEEEPDPFGFAPFDAPF